MHLQALVLPWEAVTQHDVLFLLVFGMRQKRWAWALKWCIASFQITNQLKQWQKVTCINLVKQVLGSTSFSKHDQVCNHTQPVNW
jgi:hypothetical protein